METKKFVDENMLTADNKKDGITWYKVNAVDMDLYGVDTNSGNDEALSCRIPFEIASKVNNGVADMNGFGAGVRLRFGTDSTTISIRAEYGRQWEPTCMSLCAIHGFDLYKCQDDRTEIFRHMYRPANDGFDRKVLANDSYVVKKDTGLTYYTLNFPLYSEVTNLYIGLDEGSKFTRGMKYKNELPVVFYGSSITHGAAASRPGNIYEAFIAQKYNMNFVNLGFAGSARAEDTMTEYLASRKMCMFVSDYDFNAPNVEHLNNTHYKMYETIRAKNPDIPYVMISRPNFFHCVEEAVKRRDVVIASYKKALANGDKNVYFIDGETLLQGEYMESCTVEGTHPTDVGFMRMANVIGTKINEILKLK